MTKEEPANLYATPVRPTLSTPTYRPTPEEEKVNISDDATNECKDDAINEESNSQSSPERSRSAQIREIVSRQDSFDNFISYPSSKRVADSPQIATDPVEHVTPDQVFGPVSPRKNEIYNVSSDLVQPRNSRETITLNKPGKGRMSEGESSRKMSQEQLHKSSPIEESETPLKSFSRFESPDKTVGLKRVQDFSGALISENGIHDIPGKNGQNDHSGDNIQNRRESRNYSRPAPAVNTRYISPSYDHSHMIDENLHISDFKLNNTLLKMYSQSRDFKRRGSFLETGSVQSSSLSFAQGDFIGLEPVLWRIHPMDATHKETLEREMDFLAFHVKPLPVISKLYQDGILTSQDYNQLIRINVQGNKAVTRLLVKTLQRRGVKAYSAFVDALLVSDQEFVCEHLSNSRRSLHQGLTMDRVETDWMRHLFGNNGAPNQTGISTPYNLMNPFFTNGFKTLPYDTYSTNQTFPSQYGYMNDSPLSNQIHHLPMASFGMTPHTERHTDPVVLEARLNHLSAGLKTLHENIMALRTDRPFSPWPETSSRTAPSHQTDVRSHSKVEDGRPVHVGFLEQQLEDLKGRMAELNSYVASLKVETSQVQANETENFSDSENGRLHPRQKTNFSPHLEEQFRSLTAKVRDLQEEVAALKAKKYKANQNGRQDSESESSLSRHNVPPNRIINAKKMHQHLRELKRELDLLHDDVTALKSARTFGSRADNSLSRPLTRQLPSEKRWGSFDNDHGPNRLSKTIPLLGGGTDPYSTSPVRPTHSQLYTRYPSRYSPGGAFKHDSDGRSTSRADSRAGGTVNGPGHRKNYETHARPESRRNNKQSNDGFKQDSGRKSTSRTSSRTDSRNEGTINSPRDTTKSESHIRSENNPYTDLRNEGNQPHSRKDDSKLVQNNQTFYQHPENKSGLPTGASLVGRDPHLNQQVPVSVIVTDEDGAHNTTTGNQRYKTTSPPPPAIDTNRLTTAGTLTKPKSKKRISYNDEAVREGNRPGQSSLNSSVTRIRNEPLSLRHGDHSGDFTDDYSQAARQFPRPPSSVTDSGMSINREYKRVTTPTRVLSPPPDEVDNERITWPYKILANPQDKIITTWSENSAYPEKR